MLTKSWLGLSVFVMSLTKELSEVLILGKIKVFYILGL